MHTLYCVFIHVRKFIRGLPITTDTHTVQEHLELSLIARRSQK